MKTAMQELYKHFEDEIKRFGKDHEYYTGLSYAKTSMEMLLSEEKEKQQNIDFFVEGCNTMSGLKYGGIDDFNIWAEKYYNETFKP